jgi:hypothetical protein
MFERGNPFPWLDHKKYPWISLTNAAVYLSRRDESGRSRAVYCHEWEPPFSLLFEWIDGGLIAVCEGLEDGFKPVRKQEFLLVPIKFPSYTLADGLEVMAQFQRGQDTFIECHHNLSRFTQARDRLYVRDSAEPRWHDLKVRSEEVVAAVRTTGIDLSEWLVPRPRLECLRVSA